MEDLLFGGRKSNNQPQRKSVKSGKQLDIAMKSLVSQLKITSTGLSPMQQLELKYNADNIDDLNELRTILSKKLKYPSQSVAETHHNANRLGHYDIHRQKEELSLLINDNTRFCACCGFVEQEQTLSINQDLKNIDHIGVSTYIYFLTIKNILVLMISMMIVFSFYALITNKTASNMYSSYQKQNSGGLVDKKVNSYDGELAYSLGSKQLYKTSYGVQTFRVQCWLGVATISLWALLFVFFKYRQQTAEYDVDYDSITASDFSLYFENLPKSMTPQLLQRQLRQYQQQMKGYYKSHLISDPITVVKIVEATPFYLDESSFDDKQLKSISKQFEECKQKLIEMVEERKDGQQFKMSIDERTELYNKFQFLKNKKVLRLKEITDEIIEQKKQQSINWNVVPAFVTFGSSYSKQFLQRVHDKTSYKFIYTLPCLSGRRKYFHYQSAHGQKVAAKILPAPQPQDILWTNLGQDTCQIIKKKMLTFFVTLVLLTISFFVTYFMSSLQLSLGNTGTEAQKSMRSTILSTAISLFISIFNIVINKILYILTKYERNETYIDEQTSLGLKAAFAVLINSILIPIIVNKTLKYNLYGVDGLAQDVYYLAITNALLSPILKIIDPSFFTNRAMRWYYNRPYNRLPLNQNQLNDINELLQFSIGYQYIYLVNVFLFTCFFVSLQPVIVFFAIIGLFLMFYAQKYYLFNRCRRPTPGYTSINTAMYQLFYLGPMMYSLGSFCWSNFFDLSNTVGTVPNTVAIIISGVVFILPYKKLLKCIVAQRPEQKLVFEEDRIFLPSEYDRMNPQTAEKASIQYKDYIANYKDKLKNKSSSQIQQVVYQLNRQCGTGHRSNRHIVPRMPGFFGFEQASSVDDQMVVQQLLGGINRNSINPLIIGNSVLPDSSNRENAPISINTVAQNWLTQQELSNNRNSGIQNINPIAGLLQNLTKDQGETVNYQTTNVNAENTGDINLNFGNLIQNDIFGGNRFNNHPHGGRHPGNRGNGHNIPMNLPLNLFGNMLNTNVNPNKNAWENWGS